jgi:hypothetical protein
MSDQTLKERLGTEPARPRVVAECVTLVDAQVKAKSGLSGVAVKGAYGTIKRIKKRFVSETINGLLDEWLDKLQPYFDTYSKGGTGSFSEFLTARSEDVAEDLLSVTDGRAGNSKHKTAAKMYKKMRPSAKKNVVQAIPDLATLIERNLDPALNQDVPDADESDSAAQPAAG